MEHYDHPKGFFSVKEGIIIPDYEAIHHVISEAVEEGHEVIFKNFVKELEMVWISCVNGLNPAVKINLSSYAEKNIDRLVKYLLAEKFNFRFQSCPIGKVTPYIHFTKFNEGGFEYEYITKPDEEALTYDKVKALVAQNLANQKNWIQLLVVFDNE